MRKLSAGLSITVDGTVDGEPEWVGAHFSPEFAQTIRDLQAAGDTMLLGRKTYQYFQQAFGDGDSPEADYLNNVRKIVASRTLKTADWNNSTIVSTHLEDEVAKLKRERSSKKDINVSGSISLTQWLLKHELVDELHLIVFPVLRPKGRKLFEGFTKQVDLTLADSQQLPNGVVHQIYQIG